MTVDHEDGRTDLHIEMRNLRHGQVIEMTVMGEWTEVQLEDRLDRLIRVRQPTEIHLRLPIGPSLVAPYLQRTRDLLAEFGGAIVVLHDNGGQVEGATIAKIPRSAPGTRP